MNNHISIHDFSVGFMADDCERYEIKRIPNKVHQSKAGSHDLGGVRSICSEHIFGGLRTGCADSQKIKATAQFLLQCYLGELRMQVAKTSSITIRIQELDVQWTVRPTRAYAMSAWNGAFYYSVILRAKKTIQEICDLPYHVKFIHDGEASMLDQAMHKFMISLGEDDLELAEDYLTRAEKYLANFPRNWGPILRIHFPLWRTILEKNQAALDAQLESSLLIHKSYWSQPTETEPNWMNFSEGHFNLPLTAIMAFAFDRGMQINWSSDYTPFDLVRGDFQTDWDATPVFLF